MNYQGKLYDFINLLINQDEANSESFPEQGHLLDFIIRCI